MKSINPEIGLLSHLSPPLPDPVVANAGIDTMDLGMEYGAPANQKRVGRAHVNHFWGIRHVTLLLFDCIITYHLPQNTCKQNQH